MFGLIKTFLNLLTFYLTNSMNFNAEFQTWMRVIYILSLVIHSWNCKFLEVWMLNFEYLLWFLIASLHRDLRNDFFFQTIYFFQFIFGRFFPFCIWTFIPFSIGTFISFLDFYFFFGLLFLFYTFISFFDFYFSFCTNRDLILNFFQVF